MGSDNRAMCCRTLMQNGHVEYWYSDMRWHWVSTACWASADRTTPLGRLSRSANSMNGPNTRRRVRKKALIKGFIPGIVYAGRFRRGYNRKAGARARLS